MLRLAIVIFTKPDKNYCWNSKCKVCSLGNQRATYLLHIKIGHCLDTTLPQVLLSWALCALKSGQI